MRSVLVYAFSLATLLAVVSPAFRDPPADSFPLSDYPMFSHGRPDPMLTLPQALGVRGDERVPLPPMVAAGNREVLQAMMTIAYAIPRGEYCSEVAERVAQDPELEDVEAVEIATSTFDCVAYFDGDPEPRERVVHQRCVVPR